MSFRIVKINVNDLLFDSRQASSVVNDACLRSPKSKVTGAFQKGDNAILLLESLEGDDLEREWVYVFAPFPDPSEKAMLAEISSRYYYGFSALSCFEFDGQVWALFHNAQATLKPRSGEKEKRG